MVWAARFQIGTCHVMYFDDNFEFYASARVQLGLTKECGTPVSWLSCNCDVDVASSASTTLCGSCPSTGEPMALFLQLRAWPVLQTASDLWCLCILGQSHVQATHSLKCS
jgi:hypothetical protein